MAKVYFRKYKERIDRGELTIIGVIDLAEVEVPIKWRAAVIKLLEELNN